MPAARPGGDSWFRRLLPCRESSLQLQFHRAIDGNTNYSRLLVGPAVSGENAVLLVVKLLDLNVPQWQFADSNGNQNYYIQVIDPGAVADATYGLAVYVPEPGTMSLLVLCGSSLLMRKRSRATAEV